LKDLLLRLVFDADYLQQTQVPALYDISLDEAEVILTDDLVLALVDVLPLQFSVFVDDIVQGVDVHVRAEANQDVPHHLVYTYPPLDRSEAVGVDRVGNIEVEEVKLLLQFVEGRLDEGGIRKGEVLVESSIECD
jgi:hypothetical protein